MSRSNHFHFILFTRHLFTCVVTRRWCSIILISKILFMITIIFHIDRSYKILIEQ